MISDLSRTPATGLLDLLQRGLELSDLIKDLHPEFPLKLYSASNLLPVIMVQAKTPK